MSFGQIGAVALAVYLVALLAVAELARMRMRGSTPPDHFLAGRDLGTFVLFLTLYATAYSGNSLLGYPGKAYASGYSFVMATGFMMSIIIVFHLIAPKLRPLAVSLDFVTPGDWIRERFSDEEGRPEPASRALVVAVATLMTLALANFLLAQLKAMGHVTSQVTDGQVPFAAGVAGLAFLILVYETRGGMRAVAWTDAAQGILMMVGLMALLAWLIASAGGFEAVTRSVSLARPEAVAVPDARTCVRWFSTTALLGLASVLYPQAIQRIYAARTSRSLRHSFALMTFMPLTTTLVVTMIGVAAIPLLDLPAGSATDRVMPMLLGEWANESSWGTVGAVGVFLGALAAIMSTADSCLLSLGSLVAQDLFDRPGGDPATTRFGKIGAGVVLFAAVPLALEEITLWRLIELKMELLIQCVPAFLMAMHWSGQSARATLWGLVAGTVFSVGLTLAGPVCDGLALTENPLAAVIIAVADGLNASGVHLGVYGLALNALIVVLGSAWSRRASPPSAHARTAALS